jgi:hypothetical protein
MGISIAGNSGRAPECEAPMTPFGLVFREQPLSSAASHKQGYIGRVADIARGSMGTRGLLTGPLYVHIVWFHRVRSTGDVDNIAKNIIDAMKQVVYEDDQAIVRCEIERIDARGEAYTFTHRTPPPPAFEALEELLGNEPSHAVYVEVGPAGPREIFLGPGV